MIVVRRARAVSGKDSGGFVLHLLEVAVDYLWSFFCLPLLETGRAIKKVSK